MPHEIAFRVDASLHIGSGHIVRCLTLAMALRERGASCHFICREHPGNHIDQIRSTGFAATVLATAALNLASSVQDGESLPAHAAWLGTSWQVDAEATRDALQSSSPDWLVVDHYALDRRWELALRPYCTRLMVIDDLADRPHACDVLLDQNLGSENKAYTNLVPATCTMLTGTRYALLRPEFAALRAYSLQRRTRPQLRQLLITLGGVDQSNATGHVLEALRQCPLPPDCRITIVMGLHAPWLAQIQAQAADLPWPCEVKVNVNDIAQLMADSDLVIGAAGGTSWERCVLGLPTLMVVIAENQKSSAAALVGAAAVVSLGDVHTIGLSLRDELAAMDGARLTQLSEAASRLADGRGTERVIAALISSRCIVRSMREADLADVLQWRNHPDVRRFMYTKHEISSVEHRAWFEHALKDPKHHLLIVEDDGKPLGFVQFTDRGDGTATWGFYLAPYVSKGNGKKLAGAALNHAFQHLSLKKVYGEAIASNERSVLFHRRLGFRDEGILRDGYFDGHDHHDVCHFAILASEWHEQYPDSRP